VGKPVARARREARGRRRFDRVAREAVLQRVGEVGAAVAAREAGVAVSTLRTWRRRLAADPVPAVVEVAEPAVSAGGASASVAERRRVEAERERSASVRARDQADAFLARGDARGARDATVASRGFAELAAELEEAARAEELHAVALADAEGELLLDVIDRLLAAVEVKVPREVVEAALCGEIPAELAVSARERVRARLRASVEAEVAAARFTARHAPPEPEGDPELDQAQTADADVEEPTGADAVRLVDVDDDLVPLARMQPELAKYEQQRRNESGAQGGQRARRRSWTADLGGPAMRRHW
jgi:hypothetical protein